MLPQPARAARLAPRARRVGAALAAAVLALALALLDTGSAQAATAAPRGCAPDPDFSYTNVSYSHIQGPPYTQGGPGHHLSIALSAGMTVTATATGTVSIGLSAIVAGAKADVSASLAVSFTASVTYTDSWTVPSNVTQGFLAAGASSRVMRWSHGRYNGACAWIVDGSGTLNAPYHLPAFWSWTS